MNELRIVSPNLSDFGQIHLTGLGLINLFASDLLIFIDKHLIESEGNNWLLNNKVKDLKFGEINLKDPSALLKELTRNGQSILRKPINLFINKAQLKDFYDRLEDVLDERHKWVHNEVVLSIDSLENLIITIKKIAWLLELPVIKECDQILGAFKPDIDEPQLDSKPKTEVQERYPEQIPSSNSSNEVINEEFLPHSYTLHLSGSIRDRKTDNLLEDLMPSSKEFGKMLLKQKPSGGRLKITKSGQIAGFQDNSWVYMAKVEPNGWFPGHLG
jgi:hypothetical protein